jgi:filamentous hemagglutinin family protein
MHPRQAYRAVPLAFLLACAVAQAQDGSPSQILLAPGKSITFVDQSNAGMQVVITAPAAAHLNLSHVIAASEKFGMYSVLLGSQINEAGEVVRNADGSVALRSGGGRFIATGTPLPANHVTLGGGLISVVGTQFTVHTNQILSSATVLQNISTPRPAVTLTSPQETAKPVPTVPTGASVVATPGMQIAQPAQQSVANWQSFSIGAGNSVNVIQPNSSGASLNRVTGVQPSVVYGTMGANGQITLQNAGAGVSITPTANGGVTINTAPGVTLVINNTLPSGGNIVIPTAMPTLNTTVPSGAITTLPAGSVNLSTGITTNAVPISAGSISGAGAITVIGTSGGKPPATPVVTPR